MLFEEVQLSQKPHRKIHRNTFDMEQGKAVLKRPSSGRSENYLQNFKNETLNIFISSFKSPTKRKSLSIKNRINFMVHKLPILKH